MFGAIILALFAAAPIDEAKAPAPKPTKEPKICRIDEETGSRMGVRKICKTAAEWRALEDPTGMVEERKERRRTKPD
ncbi:MULTISPECIES: hypothetical protein [unclassified Sphingomonas]|uniref:hypothetical protein n=1 Tax=unclassified Sphingomonas TaxID=196159 RepID=UPI002151E18B|nr:MULTISPECIES: hypothetical protein [unclassified Sphingomonas]MCR5870299.1 hypothetical protein [Sphingomonas sp. J344]UUX98018.1 hypothetical protein LRS08_10245 [Sphingomonas sp. J315]